MKTLVTRQSTLVTATCGGTSFVTKRRPSLCGMAALVIAAVLFVIAVPVCHAADPSFAYQGVLREVDGSGPTEKNRAVEFRIYDQATGGDALWGRTCNVLLDTNGLFNATIGDASGSNINGLLGTGLASILAAHAGTTLYVGITVDNTSGEISPRQTLLAVPYSIYAADTSSASGDFTVAGRTTLQGALDVAGATTLGAVQATSLTVSGNVSLSTAGSFSGYGTVPVGGIIMWSGSASAVPDGWALCNGQTLNGRKTPDLRGKFVVGYDQGDSDYSTVGNTGGEKTHTLTVGEMPRHSHNITMWGGDIADDWKKQNNLYLTHDRWSDLHNTRTTDSAGESKPHENRPPYYAICFIMRVK